MKRDCSKNNYIYNQYIDMLLDKLCTKHYTIYLEKI
jgi:hypothetical protein